MRGPLKGGPLKIPVAIVSATLFRLPRPALTRSDGGLGRSRDQQQVPRHENDVPEADHYHYLNKYISISLSLSIYIYIFIHININKSINIYVYLYVSVTIAHSETAECGCGTSFSRARAIG